MIVTGSMQFALTQEAAGALRTSSRSSSRNHDAAASLPEYVNDEGRVSLGWDGDADDKNLKSKSSTNTEIENDSSLKLNFEEGRVLRNSFTENLDRRACNADDVLEVINMNTKNESEDNLLTSLYAAKGIVDDSNSVNNVEDCDAQEQIAKTIADNFASEIASTMLNEAPITSTNCTDHADLLEEYIENNAEEIEPFRNINPEFFEHQKDGVFEISISIDGVSLPSNPLAVEEDPCNLENEIMGGTSDDTSIVAKNTTQPEPEDNLYENHDHKLRSPIIGRNTTSSSRIDEAHNSFNDVLMESPVLESGASCLIEVPHSIDTLVSDGRTALLEGPIEKSFLNESKELMEGAKGRSCKDGDGFLESTKEDSFLSKTVFDNSADNAYDGQSCKLQQSVTDHSVISENMDLIDSLENGVEDSRLTSQQNTLDDIFGLVSDEMLVSHIDAEDAPASYSMQAKTLQATGVAGEEVNSSETHENDLLSEKVSDAALSDGGKIVLLNLEQMLL